MTFARVVVGAFAIGLTVTGLCSPAQGRQLANGQVWPDKLIIDNHSATAMGLPVSKELLPYGYEKIDSHCYLMRADTLAGAVSLMGLNHIALAGFPDGVLAHNFTVTQLNEIRKNNKAHSKVYLQYILKLSDGDLARAQSLVKAAERHDARCIGLMAREVKAQLDLLRQDSFMALDSAGQWVVMVGLSAESARRITLKNISLLKGVDFWTNFIAREYDTVYAELSNRQAQIAPGDWSTRVEIMKEGRREMPAPGQSDRKATPSGETAHAGKAAPPLVATDQGSPLETEAKEIKKAQAGLQAALAQARQFCLLKASVSECG